jgi:G2/mitotic-specific cyclin 2
VNIRKDGPKDLNAGADLKGKAKSKETFDGVVLKKPPSSAKPPSTIKQSLRATSAKPPSSATTTVRRGRSAAAQERVKPAKAPLEEVIEEEEEVVERVHVGPRRDDRAMTIDVAATVIPVPAPRRLNVARSAVTVSTTRVQIQKRVYQASKPVIVEDEDDEAHRAYKKRRTSSDAPEDDLAVEQEIEPEVQEADPNGDQWDDLDADDADDPLMVSEYVNEIFNYLKEVEVRISDNLCPSY